MSPERWTYLVFLNGMVVAAFWVGGNPDHWRWWAIWGIALAAYLLRSLSSAFYTFGRYELRGRPEPKG